MGYESFIALRYLGSRKKNHFISVITVISCVGVAIGVWALVVVLSVMAGFEGDLRQKILETHAHLLLDRARGNLTNHWDLVRRVEDEPELEGVSPFLRSEVMISSLTNLAGVTLKGIDVRRAGSVNRLTPAMVEGSLDALEHPERVEEPRFPSLKIGGRGLVGPRFAPDSPPAGAGPDPAPAEDEDLDDEPPDSGAPSGGGEAEPAASRNDGAAPAVEAGGASPAPTAAAALQPLSFDLSRPRRSLPGVIIGAELKKNLLVLVGDEVTLLAPLGDLGPTGPIPRSRTFRVVGVFYTGMYEYDSKMVYVTLPEAQRFLGLPGEASGLELRARDPERSESLMERLRARIGDATLRLRDWKTLNSSLFAALLLEKTAMFVILTLVILVASFNIVASLIMVVLEKKREVALLKALGADDRGIRRIFMTEGLLIGILGTVLGLAAGIATCLAVGTFGIPLDQEVYYIDRLPVQMHALDITLVALAAVAMSFVATLYPARLASRLLPAEGLRHE